MYTYETGRITNPGVVDRRLDPYLCPVDICPEVNIPLLEVISDDPDRIRLSTREPVSIKFASSILIKKIITEISSPGDEISLTDLIGFLRQFSLFVPILISEREILKSADPFDICVVCNENQGRSQISERIISAFAECFGLNINIRSRGANATPHKYNGKPNPLVRKTMADSTLPIDDATVDQFTSNDVSSNTILLVLDDSIELTDWAYNALTVLRHHNDDPFPGNTAPDNIDYSLSVLTARSAEFAFRFVLSLIFATLDHDYSSFERDLNRLIVKSSKSKVNL